MSERKAFLEKIHIKNYLSLRDVTLPFKPLTVLVGPNASGKSNVLSALDLLKTMTVDEGLPAEEFIQKSLWAGEGQKYSFHIDAKVAESQTLYHLEVKPKPDFSFRAEQLTVNDVNVISIQDGHGVVHDENGENELKYNSNELALRSAGNYGNKPVTRTLAEFIKKWQIYDFIPEILRGSLERFSPAEKEIRESIKLDFIGRNLAEVLWNWHKNSPESFRNVSDSLAYSTNLEIDHCLVDGQNQLCLLEGYEKPIQLRRASEGTLRLIAYYILLNEPELPPLIAIEEPEQNLHPGALTDIANVLEQIAQYSQVIITTHSSQLLGAFNPESLGDSLGVLLLRNRPGFGTEVLNLENYHGKKKALDGWIADFGIGSAVFDSGLLPDEMEDKAECQA
jgi:predicted ATPase